MAAAKPLEPQKNFMKALSMTDSSSPNQRPVANPVQGLHKCAEVTALSLKLRKAVLLRSMSESEAERELYRAIWRAKEARWTTGNLSRER